MLEGKICSILKFWLLFDFFTATCAQQTMEWVILFQKRFFSQFSVSILFLFDAYNSICFKLYLILYVQKFGNCFSFKIVQEIRCLIYFISIIHSGTLMYSVVFWMKSFSKVSSADLHSYQKQSSTLLTATYYYNY